MLSKEGRGLGGLLVAFSSPIVGAAFAAFYVRFLLDNQAFGGVLVSPERWALLSSAASATTLFWVFAVVSIGASAVAVLLGRWNGRSWSNSLGRMTAANAWSLAPWLQPVTFLIASRSGDPEAWLLSITVLATPWVVATGLAGWLAFLWQTAFPVKEIDRPGPACVKVMAAALLYAVVFSALAAMQYEALHVPHGDAGMYEEHLWNLLHGKGFRSQLDDGRLFLGEHFQVIHILLLPIYVLAPSLITLNIAESTALAAGALAVYSIARSRGLGPTAAWTLGTAYLLYFPLQYLNLELSWKTFRPETFGVPALLFAFAALEAHRYRTMAVMLALSLLAKEDYALVVAGAGVFLALRRPRGPLGRGEVWLGLGVTAFALVFLVITMAVLIPYFRQGQQPHYTPYFGSLGKSPGAIVSHVLTHPLEMIQRVAQPEKLEFVAMMLLPLGLLPLASPARFLVAAPVFGYLMLSDLPILTQPWFHFHAPLIPVLFWATTAGIANLGRFVTPTLVARFVACLALTSGIWFGKSPLSWRFYDPLEGVQWRMGEAMPLFDPRGIYWRDVYLPSPRSQAFANAFAVIEPTERVAATDYIRSRFTHHAAAHDYPTLRGHVTIDDIDVIVLDKTEGWWGRGETNGDRELLDCLNDPRCQTGATLNIRGKTFTVVYNDPYFLVVRKNGEGSGIGGQGSGKNNSGQWSDLVNELRSKERLGGCGGA